MIKENKCTYYGIPYTIDRYQYSIIFQGYLVNVNERRGHYPSRIRITSYSCVWEVT